MPVCIARSRISVTTFLKLTGITGQQYTVGQHTNGMKKQTEQKTKGRKASEPSTAAPAASKASETLSKSKIASLKDKNAGKTKKGNKR